MRNNYIENTKTDKDGRFYFHDCEFPDSTWFIVNTVEKSDRKRMDLILDKKIFPERTLSTIPSAEIDRMQMAKYADKVEMQYMNNGGERMYELEEVTITAESKPVRYSIYGFEIDESETAKMLEEFPAPTMTHLLGRLAPHGLNRGQTSFEESDSSPLLLVDDLPMDIEYLNDINPNYVAQATAIPSSVAATVFGPRGIHGVIMIFMKRGENSKEYPPFHIKYFSPLSYQTLVEFYAPKYDTSEKRNAQTPDFRTTIHWQPVVQTDSSGEASFEFYTADNATSYTVVIEGLANDGSIIRKKAKTW